MKILKKIFSGLIGYLKKIIDDEARSMDYFYGYYK